MKTQRFLGNYIVKVCPYDGAEFQTGNRRQAYCSPSHQRLDKQRRRRQREQAARDRERVLAKPWGEYRVKYLYEPLEAPERRLKAPEPVVERYQKIPVMAMSNFQSTFSYNLPLLDDGTCVHGHSSNCPECWLGL